MVIHLVVCPSHLFEIEFYIKAKSSFFLIFHEIILHDLIIGMFSIIIKHLLVLGLEIVRGRVKCWWIIVRFEQCRFLQYFCVSEKIVQVKVLCASYAAYNITYAYQFKLIYSSLENLLDNSFNWYQINYLADTESWIWNQTLAFP